MPMPICISFCLGSFNTVNCRIKKNATTSPRASATSPSFSAISYMPVLYVSKSPFVVIDSSITAIIGPIEHSAISPKLFSLELLPPIVEEIPTPNAIINGTVMGPVVTPPESNAIAV